MSDDKDLRNGIVAGDDVWLGSTVVTSLPIVDSIQTDGGMVVMVAYGATHWIVRLSDLGGEILDAVAGGTTLDELEVAMVGRLGPPIEGDLSGAVRAAVRALSDAGLVSVIQRHPM
jgi:hypothetical protein